MWKYVWVKKYCRNMCKPRKNSTNKQRHTLSYAKLYEFVFWKHYHYCTIICWLYRSPQNSNFHYLNPDLIPNSPSLSLSLSLSETHIFITWTLTSSQNNPTLSLSLCMCTHNASWSRFVSTMFASKKCIKKLVHIT